MCKRTKYYKSNNGQCLECPTGANCSRSDGMTLLELHAYPGYWRSTVDSDVFPRCDVPENCCPEGCLNLNSSSRIDDQCELGYTSALCMSCADNYVTVNGKCVFCEGGGSFVNALVPMLSACVLLFIILLAFVLCSGGGNSNTKLTRTRSVRLKKLRRMKKLFGQMKILLSLLQIFSSAPSVITSVEFPSFFRKVANVFSVFNLDVLSFSGFMSCSMSVRFFDQFLIHMMLPLGCCLAIVAAWGVAHRCTSRNALKHTQINETVFQAFILITLLLFPGLSTKVFQVWKCTSVAGMGEVQFLVQDYKIQCNQGEHVTYVVLAAGFLLLYIVGIPLTMFTLMFRNRKILHDESNPKHHAINNALGGLYDQCQLQ